jgi:hypothetical protein
MEVADPKELNQITTAMAFQVVETDLKEWKFRKEIADLKELKFPKEIVEEEPKELSLIIVRIMGIGVVEIIVQMPLKMEEMVEEIEVRDRFLSYKL